MIRIAKSFLKKKKYSDGLYKDYIIFSCLRCYTRYIMEFPEARYYIRSKQSVECTECGLKLKLYCLDIFKKFADDMHKKELAELIA